MKKNKQKYVEIDVARPFKFLGRLIKKVSFNVVKYWFEIIAITTIIIVALAVMLVPK